MRHLQGLLKGSIVVCMMGIAVTTAIGVIFRYAINSPLFWTDEISRYALVWMTFLGGALLVGESDGHVRVDFFVDRMGRAARRVAVVLSTLVEVAIVLLATAGGVIWLQASSRATSAAVGIPMPLIYAVIPFSGLAALAFILCRFLGNQEGGAGDD